MSDREKLVDPGGQKQGQCEPVYDLAHLTVSMLPLFDTGNNRGKVIIGGDNARTVP
jgi:hypothetical protein